MTSAAIPLLVGSTILQAGAQQQAGKMAMANSNLVANQYETGARIAGANAKNQDAIGIAKAGENLRQNRFLQSKILAMSAAGGGSATTNKNIADLLSKTAGEGEYSALNSIYEGSSRGDQLRNEAIGLYNKAAITRFEGKQAKKASQIAMASSILGGGAKGTEFYSKYNNPAPTDYSSSTAGGFYD